MEDAAKTIALYSRVVNKCEYKMIKYDKYFDSDFYSGFISHSAAQVFRIFLFASSIEIETLSG